MLKAYKIASAILGEDFNKLNWGKAIQIKEAQYDDCVIYLNRVVLELTGQEGFDAFQKQFSLKPITAYCTVRVLKGVEFVKTLNWPVYSEAELEALDEEDTDEFDFDEYDDDVDVDDVDAVDDGAEVEEVAN